MVSERKIASGRLWLAWVVASGFGMAAGWLAAAPFVVVTVFNFYVAGVALGALAGVVGWLTLRQRATLSKSWIVLAIGGWAVCGLVLAEVVPAANLSGRDYNPITGLGDGSIAIVGAVLGASIGAVIASLQWVVSRNSVAGARSMIFWSAAGGAAAGLVIAGRFVGSDFAAAASLGAVAGAVLGAVHWVVLRRRVANAWPWVLSSSVAWAAAMATGVAIGKSVEFAPDHLLLSLGFGGVVMGAVVGLLLGGLQWLTLRAEIPGAGWWFVACGVGWAVGGLVAAGLVLTVEEGGGLLLLAVGAAIGLVAGAITGVAVVRLMPRPRAAG